MGAFFLNSILEIILVLNCSEIILSKTNLPFVIRNVVAIFLN